MELHPILDETTNPSAGLWYVLSARGDCPSRRVGHTCTYVPGPDGHGGKVYVIGGANPDGSFGETYILDLDNFGWDTCESTGFKGRYEHSAFIPTSQPGQIYVFGGASQSSNFNDIQIFNTSTQTWTTPNIGGTPPSPRTYHVSAAAGDKFIVYSGGQSQADPVGDRQVHCFDASESSWSTLNVKGDPPKPRHGHLVLAVGNKVYIHGGMAGMTFYDDLQVLDLGNNTWKCIKKKGHPCARAAHSGMVLGSDIYIFGGMCRNGALDDMYKFNTETQKWARVELEGPPPANRLDMALCGIRLSTRPLAAADQASDILASSQQASTVLDQQMRMGSAGSVRSVGSAGSHHSAGSSSGQERTQEAQKVLETPPNSNTSSPKHTAAENSAGDQGTVEGATSKYQNNGAENNIIDLCLIMGGMDTVGEIFDDCMVVRLNTA